MVKLEWGTKRACQGCMARFYDMRRTPIICPECKETFEIQTPGRKSRSRSSATDDAAVLPLEDTLLGLNLDLPGDLDVDLEDEEGLIEDTSDLGEDLDDMADVLDTVDENEEN